MIKKSTKTHQNTSSLIKSKFWISANQNNFFLTGINKSHTADMYAPSTVNGDTITGELSSVSDEKSDVNFDANDYVVSAISQYVLSNK